MTECLYPSSDSLLRIQALLQYSSLNLDMKDKVQTHYFDGNTALIFACQSGRLDLVDLLLTAAATQNINLNAQNLVHETRMFFIMLYEFHVNRTENPP
jgi:ankyrin repeat protein